MCKTRGLSTAILMSLCFIEEITASSQTHTITLGEYLTFFFFLMNQEEVIACLCWKK